MPAITNGTLLIGKRTSTESTYVDIHDISLDLNGAYAPIPEPTTGAQGLFGITVLLLRRKRH